MSIGKTNVGIADLLRDKWVKEVEKKNTALLCIQPLVLGVANKLKRHLLANQISSAMNFSLLIQRGA